MNACLYCDAPAKRVTCGSVDCRRKLKLDWASKQSARNFEAGTLCHCGKGVQAKGLCKGHYIASRRAIRGRETERRVEVPCAACGQLIMRRPADMKVRKPTCGYACRSALTHGAWPHSVLPADHPVRRRTRRRARAQHRAALAAQGIQGRSLWYVGRCRECGTWFTSLQPKGAACSKRCADRASRARRRARKHDAFVAPVYRLAIFERDKWKCQLCGKKVRRNAVAPHPLAPTIDHMIPLASGGTHEPANCHLAHFICNARKSAGGGGEQLALIG